MVTEPQSWTPNTSWVVLHNANVNGVMQCNEFTSTHMSQGEGAGLQPHCELTWRHISMEWGCDFIYWCESTNRVVVDQVVLVVWIMLESREGLRHSASGIEGSIVASLCLYTLSIKLVLTAASSGAPLRYPPDKSRSPLLLLALPPKRFFLH